MFQKLCLIPLMLLLTGPTIWAASGPGETFAGLTIGQPHSEIAKKIRRRENLVGPGKGIFDSAGKLTAKTFRYTGSFNRDRYVENVMLYFSSKGTLAGFDLYIKSRTTFERYGRDVARQYEKVSDTTFAGEVSSGRYKGAPISVELMKSDAKKAKYRSYVIEIRCPAILAAENISMKEAEKKAAESATGRDRSTDDARKLLKRAL